MLKLLFNGYETLRREVGSDCGGADYYGFSVESGSFFKCFISYLYGEGLIAAVDEFFLEKGKYDFGSFFRHGDVKRIVRLQFENLCGDGGYLYLSNESFTKKEKPQGVKYIQNGLFALGVDLDRGGAAGRLVCKKYDVGYKGANELTVSEGTFREPENGLSLINGFDKGRLIQQSYYGAQKMPYQAGNFFGNVWRFNPVQSGDKKDNSSFIADYSISSDEIYIKVRPMDWGRENCLTDTYMECRYSFYKDCIRIDNTFIDFSMLDHSDTVAASQERPAFYPIAPLSRFVSYRENGTEKIYGELGFWADPVKDAEQRIGVPEGMSAWVNAEGFGLGLYTPDSKVHLCGRYKAGAAYECLPELADPVSYTAAIEQFNLENLKKYSYTYYIFAGFKNEIYDAFAEIKADDEKESGVKGVTA